MFDTIAFARALGYLGVAGVVFTETGLLIGLFLPGDSLLFSAGFVASLGYLQLAPLCVISFLAAAIGDSVGYALGKKYGPKVFVKEQSLFFDKQHIVRAEAFYKKHGGKAVVLARFIPMIRTIAPVLAGVGSMPYRAFLAYNLAGAALWTVGITSLGYFLGRTVPHANRYVLPTVLAIIVISLIPTSAELWKRFRERKQ